jgi:hypothetical protein
LQLFTIISTHDTLLALKPVCRAKWGYTLVCTGIGVVGLNWCKLRVDNEDSAEAKSMYSALGAFM